MRKSPKLSPKALERALRMVFDARDEYPSEWAGIEAIAGKIGCAAETLRKWMRQGERDNGKANEILKLAGAHFTKAEPDRQLKN